MINLETQYLGLKLKNPIIVSSSGLTNNVGRIVKMEEHGAAAVVLKSLFEEQIKFDSHKLLSYNDYPEANDYIAQYSKNNSIDEYLNLIVNCKKEVEIPIIASINCISSDDWITFAKKIEDAGANALELNIHIVPTDRNVLSSKIEEKYFEIISKVADLIKIPIAVKIGTQFSNLVYFIDQLYANRAKGVVLFNRFYEPDIDIHKMQITSSEIFSNPIEIRNSLRWIGILSAELEHIDISASTGIHDAEAVAKLILAGATTVQLCSVLYKSGIETIANILRDFQEWITENNFSNIDEFRGKLNYKSVQNNAIYERAQFMKYFSKIE